MIIGDGLQGVKKLPEGDLKDKIHDFFKKIEELIEGNFDLEKLAKIAKQLTISVLDALSFKDTDLLPDTINLVDSQLSEFK